MSVVTNSEVLETSPENVCPTLHRIPSIDGLRAISIMMVLVAHCAGTMPPRTHLETTFIGLFGNGDLGVLIFFVISGFLITSLMLNERQKTGTIDLLAFYQRRAYRILPPFLALMLVIAVLWKIGSIQMSWSDYLPALFFLRDYSSLLVKHLPRGDWFVGHTWSLSIEEQFYLLWPLILTLINRKKAIKFTTILICVLPLIRIAQYVLFPAFRGNIPIMFHTRLDSIMTGALIALLYREPSFTQLLQKTYRTYLPGAAAIFLFLISPFITAHFKGQYLLPIGWTLENTCAGYVLLWSVDNSQTLIGSILNTRAIRAIGVISYSLYLWQQLFLTGLNQTITGKFPFNIAFVFIAAAGSYFLIEQPILRYRKGRNLPLISASAP